MWLLSSQGGQRMIVVRMQGGLGNQFFQYAVGRAVSERLACRLFLDVSWYRNLPKRATPRAWELGRYPIQAECLDPRDERSPWFCSMERLGCVLRSGGRWHWARSFRERSMDYDPRVAKLHSGWMLEGYWQSPLYFDAVSDALRCELQPGTPMGADDERVAAEILADPQLAVAVHVRRGDYLSGVHAAHHGVCDLDYYRRAFEQIRRRIVGARFFVFSDDPAWVRSRTDVFGGAHLVSHNDTSSAFQDLRLMSLCRGHVIANSSFSWWGAWLSPGSGKFVVAPSRWLAGGEPMPSLMPPEWIRL